MKDNVELKAKFCKSNFGVLIVLVGVGREVMGGGGGGVSE